MEDDTEMREMVASVLARAGYEVIEAVSGKDAARHLASPDGAEPPADGIDLVLSDIRMAEMDGLHLANMIRMARWPLPVILMTAFPGNEVRAAARRLRAVLLPKPFEMSTLREVVALALPSRRGTPGTPEEGMS